MVKRAKMSATVTAVGFVIFTLGAAVGGFFVAVFEL